ncbi:MAG: hypothetical protein AB1758_19525 [Candidatus Eremiobacterota bacterium]
MNRFARTLSLTLILGLVLSLAGWSEQVYVRNKPFKGQVSGAGKAVTVDLQGLVSAMGLTLTEVGGNWVVTAEGEEASLPEGATGTGSIYFKGQAVGSAPEGAATMVPLFDTATALGGSVKSNPGLGTIDVYLGGNQPVASTTPTQPGSQPSGDWGAGSSDYRLINFWASW